MVAPLFQWFSGTADWAKGGKPVVYSEHVNPADPSILGTTRFLSDKVDAELEAEMAYDGGKEL